MQDLIDTGLPVFDSCRYEDIKVGEKCLKPDVISRWDWKDYSEYYTYFDDNIKLVVNIVTRTGEKSLISEHLKKDLSNLKAVDKFLKGEEMNIEKLKEQIELIHGDCLEEMKKMPDNSVDSIVTDPPYGISFMAKKWDYDVPKVEVWVEALRVLKPGGHVLCACGTRTQHRMAVNLEDAGFEIRDMVAWVYGSGFPKSYNIGKNLDKYIKTGNASWNGTGDSTNGALGYSKLQHKQGYRPKDYSNKHQNKSDIVSEQAKKWEGWGTALKPAMELWTLCRKPLEEKTIASNVLKYGTGGLNIDACRVGTGDDRTKGGTGGMKTAYVGGELENKVERATGGRFPANLIHDGSDEVISGFPNSKSTGSASRFFYCAKASKKERNKGLEGFREKENRFMATANGTGVTSKGMDRFTTLPKANFHPTVKPVKLMQYLCRLITPKGGIVLDPFMGSGSTGIACKQEGFDFIGIEIDKEYLKIAKARIK